MQCNETLVRTTRRSRGLRSSTPRVTTLADVAPSPRSFDHLTVEELWDRYIAARNEAGAGSDEAMPWRNVLVERHLPLVRHIAERVARSLPRSVELDDLVSAGVFGLLDALRGFDPERKVRFKTYASTRVRGAIIDHLRSGDWVPRLVRLKAGRLEKAIAQLAGQYHREPTHAELAAELGLDLDALRVELAAAKPTLVYGIADRGTDEEDEAEHVRTPYDRRSSSPIELLLQRDVLEPLLSKLSHKERFIVKQYYAVGTTMREIGEMLGITESRVCQIHTNVLARLRAMHAASARTEGE